MDFLLPDLPPGMGDAAMSLDQEISNPEVLVVTALQLVASEVPERTGTMVHILGQGVPSVAENMSWPELTAPDAGKSYRTGLFGFGGGTLVAEALSERFGYGVPMLT